MEPSDLESAGNEALVVCALRYRESEGDFEAFAFLRVQGAMLDAGRKALKHFTRERRLEGQLFPVPELRFASRQDQVAALFDETEASSRDALVRDVRLQAAAFTAADLERDETSEDAVVDAHHRNAALTAIREAVGTWDERDQRLYRMLFPEEATNAEAAEALGVTERTVIRMAHRIRERLADALAGFTR